MIKLSLRDLANAILDSRSYKSNLDNSIFYDVNFKRFLVYPSYNKDPNLVKVIELNDGFKKRLLNLIQGNAFSEITLLSKIEKELINKKAVAALISLETGEKNVNFD